MIAMARSLLVGGHACSQLSRSRMLAVVLRVEVRGDWICCHRPRVARLQISRSDPRFEQVSTAKYRQRVRDVSTTGVRPASSSSRASLDETLDHLIDGHDSGYLSQTLFSRLSNLQHAAQKATTNLMLSKQRQARTRSKHPTGNPRSTLGRSREAPWPRSESTLERSRQAPCAERPAPTTALLSADSS